MPNGGEPATSSGKHMALGAGPGNFRRPIAHREEEGASNWIRQTVCRRLAIQFNGRLAARASRGPGVVDSSEAAAPARNQGNTLFGSTGRQPGPAGDGSRREMVAWHV